MFEPEPVQTPWPPIHVGGESEAALRRAAFQADGWYGLVHDVARREDAGVDRVVVSPWRRSRDAVDARHRCADTAVPRVAGGDRRVGAFRGPSTAGCR
jgi:alkanesulfonate monooxygenase SsuD/methylene tetrahydromethanopterin reductase-like flavin-dependent oxidoreductase (luciferase family)